ncbi:MAG: toxin-antitoxin system HicB family antitoxin [Chloroflexi bacterium]|nr:toxin-antitoxin system HicB family antitoxin [Chloroflexota bacterium]
MPQIVKLTLRLPPDLHAQLKQLALESSHSLNKMIVETLRKGLPAEVIYEETEQERALRVIKEAGLWEPMGSDWPDVEDPGLTHAEIREMLKGVPPLSDIIIEEREPR